MSYKFCGSLDDLKKLLLTLNIKGKWYDYIKLPTTQVQFKCENGEILNFYYGTHTVFIQGRKIDDNSPTLLSQLKDHLI